jgi:hypothetical protein
MRSIRFHIDQLIGRECSFVEAKIEKKELSENIGNDSTRKQQTNKQT